MKAVSDMRMEAYWRCKVLSDSGMPVLFSTGSGDNSGCSAIVVMQRMAPDRRTLIVLAQ